MWAIYFILIFSQIELPPGCEAQIKVHIKNNTNVTLNLPKIYRLSSPWWVTVPQQAVCYQNIPPNQEGIITFSVSSSSSAPVGQTGEVKFRVLARNYEITPSYLTISFKTTLNKPTNLQANSSYPYNSVSLTWKDNSNYEAGYEIWRKGMDNIWRKITTVSANSTSYTDYNVSRFNDYFYKVRAYTIRDNQIIYSNFSDSVWVTTSEIEKGIYLLSEMLYQY